MTEEQYLEERLEDQIKWYSDKGNWNKNWYTVLKRIEFVLSASIPIAILFFNFCAFAKYYAASAGAVLTILAGAHGLYNFQENWIEYRATSEALKHEKYLYLTKTGPYVEAVDSFRILVERAEGIISHENINWSQINKPRSSQKTDNYPLSNSSPPFTG